jgi:L-ascorbate metabolism protein UlaG (beta-lactamase superfamily)
MFQPVSVGPQPVQAPPVSVTWIGHATVLVEAGDTRVLTDPALMARMVHLRRRVAVPAVDPVDVVLISHVHMDHLHLRSLRTVVTNTHLLVPTGARRLVEALPAACLTEVTRGDRVVLAAASGLTPEVSVQVVEANHSDRRGPHSKIVAAPVGYLIRIGDITIYFAGDTDLFDDMSTLGRIDLALIPIWGWGPTLGELHLDPDSAATATERIDPRQVLPIHWGTYSPLRAGRGSPPWLENPINAFRSALEARGLQDRLVSVPPGGTVVPVP